MTSTLRSFFVNHKAAFQAAWQRLFQNFGQTLMTALVVAISFALPLLLNIAITNLQKLGESWDTEPKLTLYIHARARESAVEALMDQLKRDQRIERIRYISADEALRAFEQGSGFGEALAGLEHNPLPAAIELSPALGYRSATQQQALAKELSDMAIVDEAAVDLQWVQRFIAITELASKLLWLLAALLIVGALLVIGNTIRLIIENRKDEIVVIKMVGGTNAFVRRPLVYSGALYGLLGALVALLIVFVVLVVVSGATEHIASAYSSQFQLQGLALRELLLVLVLGGVLGCVGAAFAVARHISHIEPS
jgi:cell division transport system permease protein